MVDLVKIRKKSKEAKEPQAEAHAPAAEPSRADASAVEPAPPAARPEPSAVALEEAPHATPAEAPAPAPKPLKSASPKGGKQAKEPAGAIVKDETPPEASVATKEAAASEAPAGASEPDEAEEDRLSRFKRLAGKRRSWGAAAKGGSDTEAAPAGAELELLRFRVAGEDYAVDIDTIVEIVPPRATTRVPNADPSIVGIMSLRGTIVTVVDLRRKLGHPAVDRSTLKDARMIVVERAGETAGFIVDRVSRVIKLDRGQIENHPVVSSTEQSEYVAGVFQAQDGLVILLDIERILAG